MFLKLPQTLVGHERLISYHTSITQEIDYEAELAAVISNPTRNVSATKRSSTSPGTRSLKDTSVRDLQLDLEVGDDELMDWFSGKTLRNTTPTSSYVVVDGIKDPQDLDIVSR